MRIILDRYKFGAGFVVALLVFGMVSSPKSSPSGGELAIACNQPSKSRRSDLIIFVTNMTGHPLANVNVTITKGSYTSTNFTSLTGYVQWTRLKHGHYEISISKFQYLNISDSHVHNKDELLEYNLQFWDVSPPQYYDEKKNCTDTITYTLNLRIMFNCSWYDNQTGIDTVLFYFDNDTFVVEDNVFDEYYKIIENLSIGEHEYYWYANDTVNNYNQTETRILRIENLGSQISLKINGIEGTGLSITFLPVIFDISSNRSGPVFLYVNYIPIFTGAEVENNTWVYAQAFPFPGVYEIIAIQPENEYYNQSKISHLLIVLPYQPEENNQISQILFIGSIVAGCFFIATYVGYSISYYRLKRKVKKMEKEGSIEKSDQKNLGMKRKGKQKGERSKLKLPKSKENKKPKKGWI